MSSTPTTHSSLEVLYPVAELTDSSNRPPLIGQNSGSRSVTEEFNDVAKHHRKAHAPTVKLSTPSPMSGSMHVSSSHRSTKPSTGSTSSSESKSGHHAHTPMRSTIEKPYIQHVSSWPNSSNYACSCTMTSASDDCSECHSSLHLRGGNRAHTSNHHSPLKSSMHSSCGSGVPSVVLAQPPTSMYSYYGVNPHSWTPERWILVVVCLLIAVSFGVYMQLNVTVLRTRIASLEHQAACLPGETYYKGSCYWYNPNTLSWKEADELCQKVMKGRLMTVDTLEEHEHIKGLYNFSGWINLNETEQEREENRAFLWGRRKTQDFINWITQAPKDGDGRRRCFGLCKAVWNGFDCESKLTSVCERPEGKALNLQDAQVRVA